MPHHCPQNKVKSTVTWKASAQPGLPQPLQHPAPPSQTLSTTPTPDTRERRHGQCGSLIQVTVMANPPGCMSHVLLPTFDLHNHPMMEKGTLYFP